MVSDADYKFVEENFDLLSEDSKQLFLKYFKKTEAQAADGEGRQSTNNS